MSERRHTPIEVTVGDTRYRLEAAPWSHRSARRWIPRIGKLLARAVRASGVDVASLMGEQASDVRSAGDAPEGPGPVELDQLAIFESLVEDEELFETFLADCEAHTTAIRADGSERRPFSEIVDLLAGRADVPLLLAVAHFEVTWAPFFATAIGEIRGAAHGEARAASSG